MATTRLSIHGNKSQGSATAAIKAVPGRHGQGARLATDLAGPWGIDIPGVSLP